MGAAYSYPMRLLRERSYPHYFAVLFAPAAARPALAALYAFQHEMLHIGLRVKEPLLGEMRLHYWQESLKAALPNQYAGASAASANMPAAGDKAGGQSPLIKALAAAAKTHILPLESLLRLCEAAAFNLRGEPMPDIKAWEKYCAEIYGAVWQNVCAVLAEKITLGQKEAEAAAAACRHGGKAQGAAALLRALPALIPQGRQPVPQDILQSSGIDDWQHFCRAAAARREAAKAGGSPGAGAEEQQLASAIAAYFHQHYGAFKQAERHLPAALRPAFLPLAVLPAFIRQRELLRRPLLCAAPDISRLRRQSKILQAALFGRF